MPLLLGLAPSPSERSDDRTRGAQVVAVALAIVIGMRVDLPFGLTAGGILAAVLAPLWARSVIRSGWVWALTLTGAAAIVSGAVLTMVNGVDHATVASDLAARAIGVAQLVICASALLWVSRSTSASAMAVAFAGGLALSIPLHVSADPNVWRFTLSIPLGVLVLALCSRVDRLWLTLVALGALAIVGLLNDSRSNSAFLLLTAIVVGWQRVARTGSRKTRGWGGLLALIATAGAILMILQAAILEGAFGEATRARTAAQIEQSGNALVGGRPEMAASFALVERYPAGLGAGLVANYDDIRAAKTAMLGIGYDPNNGYVERFMFGRGVELHSVLGDLWVWFGLAGLAFAALITVLIGVAIARGYAFGALTPLAVYVTLRAVWDLLFSPFDSALRLWPLVIALAIVYATSRFPGSDARRAGNTVTGSAPTANHLG